MNIKENLFDIIENYHNQTILVLGDLILDEYIWGKATRLSPEAPVPVLEVRNYSYILGGAANVANNISALGGNAIIAGVVGEDKHADKIKELFEASNISTEGLVTDSSRPTTVKTRLIAHNHQQLARCDQESRKEIDLSIQDKLLENVSKIVNSLSLIVLSDYAKGVLTTELVQKIIKLARQNNVPVLVDPKGLDFSKYKGATLMTPNRLEAEFATKSPSGTEPEVLARELFAITESEDVLVTLGEDGILLLKNNEFHTVPAVTSDVYDVTGAGDTLISTIALSIPASNNDVKNSILLGNFAAGVAVRRTGTTTVSPDELREIIEQNITKGKFSSYSLC